MKNLSMLLVLLTVSMPSFAQVNKAPVTAFAESGSGNGNLNRDVLDYDTKLDEATIELRTLEESFEKLINDLRALSNSKIPEFNTPGDDFWNNLAPTDQEHLMALDKNLISTVEAQIAQLAHIKEMVLTEQATINALAKEIPRYEQRGMGKDFKNELKAKKTALKENLRKNLVELMVNIEKPITEGNYNYYATEYNYEHYKFMRSCASGLCVDVMVNKYHAFRSLIDGLADIQINMIGINKKLGAIAHIRYTMFAGEQNGYKDQVKYMNQLIKDSSYRALKEINEAAVRSINN